MSNLYKYYTSEVVPKIRKQLDIQNIMQVPKIVKIVINMGLGQEAISDKKNIKNAKEQLALISGQKPIETKARKSNAGFKIREGWVLGLKVTLRGKRMYEFLERLLYVTLPRVRDFRGLPSRSFDGHGNYALGLKEQIVFPEIRYDQIDVLRGLDICVVTSANDNKSALALLRAMKFPIKEI